jgi:CheY-like chemotaxis protein
MEQAGFTGKRCLVCEDDELNVTVLAHLFKKMGLEIELASNGIEALEKLSQKKFDIILSDISMSGMNGIDPFAGFALTQIKPFPKFRSLPSQAVSPAMSSFLWKLPASPVFC